MFNITERDKKSKVYPKLLIVSGYIYIILLFIFLPIIHNILSVLGLLGFLVYWWCINKKKNIPNFKLHIQIMILLIALWIFVYPAILVYLFHINLA